jgi:hypothetical protein
MFGGPKRLDLLAIDEQAVPWVIELKRDVADAEAVGQLLMYGSMAARLSRMGLAQQYKQLHSGACLEDACQGRFGTKFPGQLNRQVNLVLAAYSFSVACEQMIEFLRLTGGIVIGRLELQQLTDRKPGHVHSHKPSRVECRFLAKPVPTKPLEPESPERRDPDRYLVISVSGEDDVLSLEDCRKNEVAVLPPDGDQRYGPIQRGTGIFLYAHDGTGEPDTARCGLVGYGVVRHSPADAAGSPGSLRLSADAKEKFESRGKSRRLLPVTWLAMSVGRPVSCSLAPPSAGITEMQDYVQVIECRAALGVPLPDDSFSICPRGLAEPSQE